jgi:hypothetical protein
MASHMPIVDFVAFLFFCLAISAIRAYQRRKGVPYPPGPQPLPVIGNLLQIPKESSWLVYTELARKYGMSYSPMSVLPTTSSVGDVFSLHVFGQVIVVLNSIKATKDLLEKRGEIYSDRPVIPFYDMSVRKFDELDA